MITNENGNQVMSPAMQRHHDYYTLRAIKGIIGPEDINQIKKAIERRLDGRVVPLKIGGGCIGG